MCEICDFPNVSLDPDLPLFLGRHYLPSNKKIFGVFSDSCPDRWARLLMQRREAIVAKNEIRNPKSHGVSPKQDLNELWKRIVFNMAVSNIDDHLRNHGFMIAHL